VTDSLIKFFEVFFDYLSGYLRKFKILLLISYRLRDLSVPPVHMIFSYRPNNVKVFFTIEIHINRSRHGVVVWKN